MPGGPPLRAALAAGLLVALTACSDPVAVDRAPLVLPTPTAPLTAEQEAACTRLLAALPNEVDPGVARRDVEGGPARLAAWGDPPVVLTCGVEAPDRPDEPVQVNGLEFSVRDTGAGFRWTTTGLPVLVAVDVPDAYENGAEIVNPLVQPVLDAVSG